MTMQPEAADAFKAGVAAGLVLAIAGTLSPSDRAVVEALIDRLMSGLETGSPQWEQEIVAALSDCVPARRLLLQVLGPDGLRTSIQGSTPMPQVANIFELTGEGIRSRVQQVNRPTTKQR